MTEIRHVHSSDDLTVRWYDGFWHEIYHEPTCPLCFAPIDREELAKGKERKCPTCKGALWAHARKGQTIKSYIACQDNSTGMYFKPTVSLSDKMPLHEYIRHQAEAPEDQPGQNSYWPGARPASSPLRWPTRRPV